MIASRADGIPNGLVLLALLALLAGDATAQTGAPVRLVPLKPDTETAPAAPEPGVGGSDGIRVEGLDAVDPEAVGTLGPGDGGFDAGLWGGTGRTLVEALLPRLPAPVTGAAARTLARRLLLTTAAAPAGGGSDASLVALRAGHLAALGDLAAADALLATSARRLSHPDEARLSVRLRLLRYDFAGACAEAAALPFDDAFGQEVLVFCQALAGESAQVSLGLDLLRESGHDPDPAYAALLEGLARGAPPDRAPATPGTLALAALHAAGAAIPATYAAARDPAILRTVALTAGTAPETRLIATRQAEAAGAVDSSVLAQSLAAVAPPAEPTGALPEAEPENGLQSLAQLYLAARGEAVPAARAELLRRLLRLAGELEAGAAAARLAAPVAAELRPAAELAWASGDMARVLLAAGRAGKALAWYRIAAREAPFDPEAAAIAAGLWPLMRIAHGARPAAAATPGGGGIARGGELPGDRSGAASGPAAEAPPVVVSGRSAGTVTVEVIVGDALPPPEDKVPWSDAALSDWLAAQAAGDAAAGRRADLLAALFAGAPVGDDAWAALLAASAGGGAPAAPAAPVLGMARAAAAGRVGETVLLALIVLGEDGIAGGEPAALVAAADALAAVGLGEDARALAVEAALAAGL